VIAPLLRILFYIHWPRPEINRYRSFSLCSGRQRTAATPSSLLGSMEPFFLQPLHDGMPRLAAFLVAADQTLGSFIPLMVLSCVLVPRQQPGTRQPEGVHVLFPPWKTAIIIA
jgi:hypothetical protein